MTFPLLWTARSNAFEVRIAGDRLTVRAERVPLQSILERIADQGIRVRMDPELDPMITASFENRDIQKGLDSILKGLNHVLIWEPIQGPLGPIPRLAEIRVFRPGKEALMKALGKKGGLSIARNPKDGSLFVKNEVLLQLRPGAKLSELKKALKKINGRVVDGYAALGIYKIRLPEGADVPAIAEAVTGDPGIAEAEPNYAYPIQSPFHDPDMTDSFPYLTNKEKPERGVPIAVVDTGLNIDSGVEDFVLASTDALSPDQPISDPQGHGTQMALIASGVVKPFGARADAETHSPIIPIRAFDENGYTSNFLIMRSIDFAVKNGARVMSLSWGSETKSGFLERALTDASSKGLIVVASAGNEPTGNPVYPAAYEAVIGVGAIGPDGKAWEKSNHGDFVTLYAPGFADLPVGYKGDPGAYAGTSISAAFVANVIANILDYKPKATMKDIVAALGGRP